MSTLHLAVEEPSGTRSSSPATDVVLLHAFPCDGRLWRAQAQALAGAGHRVLVPDLPGFGRSPLPAAPPSLDVVADLVLAGLDAVGVRRCIVGGSSLGGYVATAILRARPQMVDGLVMLGTKATADPEPARANRLRLADRVLADPPGTAAVLEEAVLPSLLGSTTWAERPGVVAEVRAWVEAARAETVAWYQRAMAARPDSVADLRAMAAPGLVVWGPEDALSPRAEQDVMRDALADGRLVEIPRAGHLCSVERPDAVAQALVGFADEVTARRTA